MKISDIINNVDKSDKFKEYVGIYHIAESMQIYDVYTHEDQERLTSYYVVSWHCTDTKVGMKVYFFDDKPVAISMQTCRKCDEDIEWLSSEDYDSVKKYVLSFREDHSDGIDLANMDQELPNTYKIYFNSQIYDYHKSIALYYGKNVKIIKINREGMIPKDITIQFEDESVLDTNIEELDFPYNLIK